MGVGAVGAQGPTCRGAAGEAEAAPSGEGAPRPAAPLHPAPGRSPLHVWEASSPVSCRGPQPARRPECVKSPSPHGDRVRSALSESPSTKDPTGAENQRTVLGPARGGMVEQGADGAAEPRGAGGGRGAGTVSVRRTSGAKDHRAPSAGRVRALASVPSQRPEEVMGSLHQRAGL